MGIGSRIVCIFRVRVVSYRFKRTRGMEGRDMANTPVPLALHSAAGHFEQAVRAEPRHYLIDQTSLASNLRANLAVKQVVDGV